MAFIYIYIYKKKSLKIWQAVIPLSAHHPQHRFSWPPPTYGRGITAPRRSQGHTPLQTEGKRGFSTVTPELQKSISILSKKKKYRNQLKHLNMKNQRELGRERQEERNWSFLERRGLPCPLPINERAGGLGYVAHTVSLQ